MAYQTYTTPAVVCGSWPRNGADKTFLLFTRELGMLYATARSVREERSRQRYALQECAEVRVSLVRGRSGWRIGSVIDIHHPVLAAANRQQRIAIVKLIRQIRRFLSGEEPAINVYDLLVDALGYIQASDTDELLLTYVTCVELRILYVLGYVAPSDVELPILQQPVASLVTQISAETLEKIQHTIKNASTVSHL